MDCLVGGCEEEEEEFGEGALATAAATTGGGVGVLAGRAFVTASFVSFESFAPFAPFASFGLVSFLSPGLAVGLAALPGRGALPLWALDGMSDRSGRSSDSGGPTSRVII